MKRYPCFLLLAGFLASLIGCQASAPMPTAISPAPSPKPKDPPGSLYNDSVVNGPLARLLRRETVVEAVEFDCVPTGNFNLAPDADHLLLQTICVEREPGENVAALHVEDTVVEKFLDEPPFAEKCLAPQFKMRFKYATVSVKDLGHNQREVRLHYQDSARAFHHVNLPERTDEEYHYSFAHIVRQALMVGIVEPRTIEVER